MMAVPNAGPSFGGPKTSFPHCDWSRRETYREPLLRPSLTDERSVPGQENIILEEILTESAGGQVSEHS